MFTTRSHFLFLKFEKLFCLQDLLKNAQYSLLLLNDTSDVTFFSNADPTVNKEEALLWQTIKDNQNQFAENIEHAEKLILENPMNVLFSSKMTTWQMKNFPCLIDATSGVLTKVFKCLF